MRCCEQLRRYAGKRFFAGGVDGQHRHAVRVGKCSAEFIKQIACAGIAMRLKDHMNTTVSTLARRS